MSLQYSHLSLVSLQSLPSVSPILPSLPLVTLAEALLPNLSNWQLLKYSPASPLSLSLFLTVYIRFVSHAFQRDVPESGASHQQYFRHILYFSPKILILRSYFEKECSVWLKLLLSFRFSGKSFCVIIRNSYKCMWVIEWMNAVVDRIFVRLQIHFQTV